MKINVCFSFLLIFVSKTIFSQIIIDGEDMPVQGTSVVVKNMPLPPISLGEMSSDAQVWDYSQLGGATGIPVDFIDPQGTISPKTFPGADMARIGPLGSMLGFALEDILPIGGIDIPPVTGYFSHQADGSVALEGLNLDLNIPGVLELGPTDLIGTNSFTFYNTGTYGAVVNTDTELSLTATDTPIGDVLLTIAMDRVSTADAYGSLSLPDFADLDVIRFSEATELNLVVATLLGGVIPVPVLDTIVNIQSYKYYSKDKDYPVASITMSPADSLGNSTISSIEYLAVPEPPAAQYLVVNGNECGVYTFVNQSSGIGLQYNWDFGDSTSSNIPTPVHTFMDNGTYTVVLTITDAFGESSTYSQEISLDCLNTNIPLAQFNASPSGICGEIAFENLSEGTGLTYSWNFGDGTTSEEASPVHQFISNDDYNVELVITTPEGLTDSESVLVSVDCISGISNMLSSAQILLQPEMHKILILGLNEEIENIRVYDLTGRSVLSALNGQNYINTAGIGPGLYIISVQTGNGQINKSIFVY